MYDKYIMTAQATPMSKIADFLRILFFQFDSPSNGHNTSVIELTANFGRQGRYEREVDTNYDGKTDIMTIF